MDEQENEKSWKYVALRLSDAEARFRAAELNEESEPEYTTAEGCYRDWLFLMGKMVESAVLMLDVKSCRDGVPERAPVAQVYPEKSAGHLPEKWRMGV